MVRLKKSHKGALNWKLTQQNPAHGAKTITVNPGQRLSYQSHEKREEHWTIVSGSGIFTLNDEEIEVKISDHVFIPKQAKHRMHNPGKEPLVFVEVQLGEYFGEDDIVRYEDDYQRV